MTSSPSIPKTIHYCWFGHSPLPADAQKCIASWKKYLPEYEIKEWNESNFDVEICPYVAEAYRQKKYAFVSDFARFWVLYRNGGIYFDTDVEVIADMSHIIENGPFMGFEKSLATNGHKGNAEMGVAPGLGIGATPGLKLFGEILDHYTRIKFDISEGTIVRHTTDLLKKHGLLNSDTLQQVAGITIYPAEYLCPMDSTTGIITLTDKTVAIHHYACTWIDHNTLSFRIHLLKNKLIKIFGATTIMKISQIIKRH